MKQKHKKRLTLLTIICLSVILAGGGWFFYAWAENYKNQLAIEKQEKIDGAIRSCNALFESVAAEDDKAEGVNLISFIKTEQELSWAIGDDVTKDEVFSCRENLKSISDEADTEDLMGRVDEAEDFLTFVEEIESKFDEKGIFRDEVPEEDVVKIETKLQSFSKGYRLKGSPRVIKLRQEFDKVQDTIKRTLAMFVGEVNVDNLAEAEVREDIQRDEYDEVKEVIESLAQEGLKTKLSSGLDNVEAQVKENERRAEEARKERERRLAEERRRQAEIAAAWVTVDVPYHSQVYAKVYNGCEVTSILMALQYKGQLGGTSIADLADAIPKSDDPDEGFYLDIYGSSPKDEAHWIEVDPLVEFAKEYSGYQAIYNMTGSSLGDLKDEIDNDNPVIIWSTYNFANPYNYSKGVPNNLHVMVLSGYNKITGDLRITDPYTRNGGQYIFTVTASRMQTLYEALGERAIVVR